MNPQFFHSRPLRIKVVRRHISAFVFHGHYCTAWQTTREVVMSAILVFLFWGHNFYRIKTNTQYIDVRLISPMLYKWYVSTICSCTSSYNNIPPLLTSWHTCIAHTVAVYNNNIYDRVSPVQRPTWQTKHSGDTHLHLHTYLQTLHIILIINYIRCPSTPRHPRYGN